MTILWESALVFASRYAVLLILFVVSTLFLLLMDIEYMQCTHIFRYVKDDIYWGKNWICLWL